MSDCLIVGGGVVGLSLAYELAGQGWRIRLLDAQSPGRQTSWAGAGILPPASSQAHDPLERLTALSNRLHGEWADELRAKTGIDNGYRPSGALYLARDAAEAQALELLAATSNQHQPFFERITGADASRLEPALRLPVDLPAAYLVREEFQLRNPWHLQALVAGCRLRGVEILANEAVEDFTVAASRIVQAQTARGVYRADHFLLAAGTWSGQVAEKLGLRLAVKPIRGQIALLRSPHRVIHRIVNEGRHYLVPREDGRLLIGSTLEDAGFQNQTQDDAIAGLIDFAVGLVPDLASAEVELRWAGLRPASVDGRPYLGRLGELENTFVATAHYRSGIQHSPGTAVLLRQLMCGEKPELDLAPFSPERGSTDQFNLQGPWQPTLPAGANGHKLAGEPATFKER